MASYPTEPWTVQVYEDGKYIGHLDPDGGVVRMKFYAGMYSAEDAKSIADEINAGIGLADEVADRQITAKATRF